MRAWRVHGPGDMRLDEIPAPVPAAGEALLQVLTAQPSITEVVGLGGGALGAAQVARAASSGEPAQLFGHEFSARVLEVRAPARGIRAGDRVSSLGRIPCGVCEECIERRPHLCSSGQMVGITRPGCFADLVAVPTSVLARVPGSVSDAEAATLQPLASVVASLRRLGPAMRGRPVAVIGLGLMGMLAVQVARALGAAPVLGISTRASAAEVGRGLGVCAFRLPEDVDAVVARERSCQVAVDCSGMPGLPGLGVDTAALAGRLCRPGGAIVQIAIRDEPLVLDTGPLKSRCVSYVMPPFTTRPDLGEAVAMVAGGGVCVAPLLARTVEGLDALPRAFAMALDRSPAASGPVQVVVAR